MSQTYSVSRTASHKSCPFETSKLRVQTDSQTLVKPSVGGTVLQLFFCLTTAGFFAAHEVMQFPDRMWFVPFCVLSTKDARLEQSSAGRFQSGLKK